MLEKGRLAGRPGRPTTTTVTTTVTRATTMRRNGCLLTFDHTISLLNMPSSSVPLSGVLSPVSRLHTPQWDTGRVHCFRPTRNVTIMFSSHFSTIYVGNIALSRIKILI